MIPIDWKNKEALLRWLAVAALAEWFIVRTVTRAAIHIPKSPLVISAYQAVNLVGQVAALFVTLLALVIMGWMAWQAWQGRQTILSLGLAGLAVLSLLFLVIVPSAWLALVYQLLAITVILWLGPGQLWMRETGAKLRQAAVLLFPALALLAGLFYQLSPTLYTAVHRSGPAPFTGTLFNLGECLVVMAVFVWWWCYGRSASYHQWLLAAIPALLFTMSFQRDPAMTGILAIWSTGLTLFLPWPLYAIALWLAGVTVLATWRHNPPVAYAILLLAAAGYAPQLSSQLFCALIGLWLLAQNREAVSRESPAVAAISRLQPLADYR